MTTSRNRVAWAGAGLALVMAAGSPVWADDTELLVSNAAGSGATKPNILFILDTSGSMNTVETTQEPYNPTISHGGDCDSSKLYWTRGSNPPDCDTDNKFDVTSFVCETGASQLITAGVYSDTMAQHRERRGNRRWQRIRRNNNDIVECRADSGVHGDGDPDDLYAQIGSNLPAFTDDDGREVAWGSSPTDRYYNVYSANYLNWFHNTPVVSMTRNEIVKAVTKNLLESINNVNVGFMEFNFEEGGPVTRAVRDLDSSRADAIAEIDSLPASGWTPLSETMYESALYWQGMDAYYGDEDDTDPLALDSDDPMNYRAPNDYACAKNYTVLLTDGEPTRDTGTQSRVNGLPGWSTALGYSGCDGGSGNGACLDDVAEYLSKHDTNSSIPGEQTVTTYTIGFTVDLPILKDTAERSGGEYYLADDVKSLTAALTEIVTSIFDKDISFTAPAVSVNAFNRTQHLNDLYISVFRATTTSHWPGNMKKYAINSGVITDAAGSAAVDPATGFFKDTSQNFWSLTGEVDGANVNSGGAASLLPDPNTRNVYSNFGSSDLTAGSNHISTSNPTAMNLATYGLIGASGEPPVEDVVEWIRGVDIMDIDNDPATFARRQMGDTLHSQPASIVYGGDGTSSGAEVVVYAATNDGQLHAIDGQTGAELWSFLPSEFLPNQPELMEDDAQSYKTYGIDGNLVPIVADRNHNGTIEPGTDFVYLIFGLRRGGDNYYALDVTNKNAPKLMWMRSYAGVGQTWSPPVATRIDIPGSGQSSADDLVLIFGAGYDTVHDQASHPTSPDGDGAGILIVDAETGNELWRAGSDVGADLVLTKMTRSIPSAVRVLDLSGNGFADRMYAADLGGQVWRLDINSGSTPVNLVTGGVIGRFGAEGTGDTSAESTRRFFSTPDVAIVQDNQHDDRYLAINVGSGYRAHPLDKSAADRFYSLRDRDVFTKLPQTAYELYPIAYDSDMIEVSGQVNTVLSQNDRGWKFTLPSSEKVLAESRTFDDTVYFVSFEPNVASTDPCQAGLSVNRLYRVAVGNGDPVVPNKDELEGSSEEEIDEARVTKLEQGGIAVRPVFLFPSPVDPDCEGAECAPPPIGCVGVECFDPGFPNNPVRTLWTQNGVQ